MPACSSSSSISCSRGVASGCPQRRRLLMVWKSSPMGSGEILPLGSRPSKFCAYQAISLSLAQSSAAREKSPGID